LKNARRSCAKLALRWLGARPTLAAGETSGCRPGPRPQSGPTHVDRSGGLRVRARTLIRCSQPTGPRLARPEANTLTRSPSRARIDLRWRAERAEIADASGRSFRPPGTSDPTQPGGFSRSQQAKGNAKRRGRNRTACAPTGSRAPSIGSAASLLACAFMRKCRECHALSPKGSFAKPDPYGPRARGVGVRGPAVRVPTIRATGSVRNSNAAISRRLTRASRLLAACA
jgi:hypothetical protein